MAGIFLFFIFYGACSAIWMALFYEKKSEAWIPIGVVFSRPELSLYGMFSYMLQDENRSGDGLDLLFILLCSVSVVSIFIKTSISGSLAVLSAYLLCRKIVRENGGRSAECSA